jgi:hypothetical protein
MTSYLGFRASRARAAMIALAAGGLVLVLSSCAPPGAIAGWLYERGVRGKPLHEAELCERWAPDCALVSATLVTDETVPLEVARHALDMMCESRRSIRSCQDRLDLEKTRGDVQGLAALRDSWCSYIPGTDPLDIGNLTSRYSGNPERMQGAAIACYELGLVAWKDWDQEERFKNKPIEWGLAGLKMFGYIDMSVGVPDAVQRDAAYGLALHDRGCAIAVAYGGDSLVTQPCGQATLLVQAAQHTVSFSCSGRRSTQPPDPDWCPPDVATYDGAYAGLEELVHWYVGRGRAAEQAMDAYYANINAAIRAQNEADAAAAVQVEQAHQAFMQNMQAMTAAFAQEQAAMAAAAQASAVAIAPTPAPRPVTAPSAPSPQPYLGQPPSASASPPTHSAAPTPPSSTDQPQGVSAPPAVKQPDCAPMQDCLSISAQSYGETNYCQVNNKGDKTYLPTLKNNCSVKIACKVCGKYADGLKNCVEWSWGPTTSFGGWATDLVWCDTSQIQVWCVLDEEPVNRECLKRVP